MDTSGTPNNKLSVYLIKQDLTDHKDILKDFNKLKSSQVEDGVVFYFDQSNQYKPSWIKSFFGGKLDQDIQLFSAISKATLLIEVEIDSGKKRVFAIPFGYGWTLLNHGSWEERFGLKVTLNVVDPNNLRRIDKKNMSSVPKDTSEQLTKDGVFADFGIDIEQDLIQSVTGKTKDDTFGKSVTGKDSFSVSVRTDITKIQAFLSKCYERFVSEDYKQDFAFIDQITEINDPEILRGLNEQLIENINKGNTDKIWMAVPELIDWSQVSGFGYQESKKGGLKDDIILSDFMASLSEDNRKKLHLDVFRKRKIYGFSASNDQVMYRWSAYNCLYCEIHDPQKTQTYLLSNAKWYEIDKDFSEQINSEYQSLRSEKPSVELPKYSHANENEYNKKTAGTNTDFHCMDNDLVSHGGGYSKIEFCDLFSKNKKIIHVKRYGGSSVLSHLFFQGIVSGELFLADPDFRRKVKDKLPDSFKSVFPNEKPNAGDYEVIFGIISSVEKDLELPFFSKVSLRSAKRRLETYGYKVSLQKIAAEKKK